MDSKLINSNKVGDILIYLIDNKRGYGYSISLDLRITYSHFLRLLKSLKKEELISFKKKDGRSKYILLTEKGKLVAKKINELRKL